MAKNITYFDREHTGGINLAAMEDTQLKENLVQDIAAGGNEAPTATAVKEAVDVKMDKADIVNDLTTGGADKALSAEQGKVLEGKKVDKLTDATDLVYVHGADGTEQGKALSEFVVDADIVDDITTGGVDKVLSAEQGKVLENKKVDKLTAAQDLVYVHEAAGTETGKALSEFVVDADIVNDRVTGGVDKVLAAEVGKDIPASFELNFTAANYPLTAATIDKSKFTDHVMSISTLYVHPDEIPAEIKGKLKKGDIVSTTVASPILSCKAIFSYIAAADETSTNVTSDIVNTSLPAAGNWESWYAFQVIVSEQDRVRTAGKTNTYCTYLFDGDETLDTLPDASGPMPTGGFSYSVVFIKPSDIKANRKTTGIPSPYVKQVDGSTIKPGDILLIDTPSSAEATKKIKSMQCLITHTAAATNKMLGSNIMNTKLPAAGNWGGWLVGRILSSGWDREALLSKTDSTKMQNYWITLPTDGETFASMPDINNVGYGKGMSGSNFFVHPNDIASISGSLKRGDIVIFTGNVSPTGETFETVTAIYTGVKATGTELLGEADLNITPPAPGNYKGWHIFYTLSTVYDRRIVQKKINYWEMTTTPGSSNIPAGLLSNRPIKFAKGKDTDPFYNFLRPGDLISVKMEGNTQAYLLRFMSLTTEASDIYPLVGIYPAPADITGYLNCIVVSSIYDTGYGYGNVLETNRYSTSQFEVGNRYRINVRPVGTDVMRLGTARITEDTADLYKIPIEHNFSEDHLMTLTVNNNTESLVGYIDTSQILLDWTLTFRCLSKGQREAIDLTTGA